MPDRERRHLLQFYLLPKMEYRTRLLWSGGLILAGLMVQLLWPWQSLIPLLVFSLPVLVAGNLLLLVRGYNLQPSQRLSGGEWEKTTRDRFDRVRDLERQITRWDQAFSDITCTSGFFCLLLLVIGTALAVFWLTLSPRTWGWAVVLAVDAAVLLLPHWVTGTRRGWRPVALGQQVDSLQIALRELEGHAEPPCQIQPMFEMAGSGSSRTPVGARVFVRFPDGPQEFLGLQLQVALNNVQGTKYPYLYAVIVARKSFGLLENHLPATKRAWPNLTVESSAEEEVDVIIIRQRTTKTSGYHTDHAAVRRIACAGWTSVANILSGVAVR